MLEGREAARADEEPNYDLDHALARMAGHAATEPPKGGANGGTDAGMEENDYPPGVHGYVVDAMGRMHPIEECGSRIRRPSRPPGFAPEDWITLNAAVKNKTIGGWAIEPALVATTPFAGSWSCDVAQQCAGEIQMDLDL